MGAGGIFVLMINFRRGSERASPKKVEANRRLVPNSGEFATDAQGLENWISTTTAVAIKFA